MRRDRLAVRRVQMDHRLRVLAGHMDGGVDGEAGGVGHEWRVADRIAVEADLDQARRGHFLEHQLIGVEQEMVLGPRHSRREMGEDEIVPAVMRDEPVGGGEVDADPPFLGAHLVLHRWDVERRERRQLRHVLPDRFDSAHDRSFLRRRRYSVGMGGGESIQAIGLGVDPDQRRTGVQRHGEPPGVEHLRDQAEVG
jgi:hypothetical protein